MPVPPAALAIVSESESSRIMPVSDDAWRHGSRPSPSAQAGWSITVFQSHWQVQVPNSKGRAVIHSHELPPESDS